MPDTGLVFGADPVERNTRYPESVPVAAVQDAVMVEEVIAEYTNAVGCAVGAAASVVALAVGADAVR